MSERSFSDLERDERFGFVNEATYKYDRDHRIRDVGTVQNGEAGILRLKLLGKARPAFAMDIPVIVDDICKTDDGLFKITFLMGADREAAVTKQAVMFNQKSIALFVDNGQHPHPYEWGYMIDSSDGQLRSRYGKADWESFMEEATAEFSQQSAELTLV